jgi:hypothetical protein
MTANLQINCKEVVNMHNGNCQSSCSQPSRQRFCIYYRHYITYTVFNRSQWTHKMPNLMFNALLMYVVHRYIETPQNYIEDQCFGRKVEGIVDEQPVQLL